MYMRFLKLLRFITLSPQDNVTTILLLTPVSIRSASPTVCMHRLYT